MQCHLLECTCDSDAFQTQSREHDSWANQLVARASGHHAGYFSMLALTFDTCNGHVIISHTAQCCLNGWADSGTSEYDSAWKPMSSENQVSPYKVRSDFGAVFASKG